MALVSCSSASVAVEKATSDLLSAPDWTTNIDICDFINYDPSQVKGVLKAVKKRLQHKSSNVQLLALTLLETILKNCGDYPRSQIAEKGILNDMVKIVKKKANMEVRERILVLLNSWQLAFGGATGKHPQYYKSFEELRRCGVEFPQVSQEASIVFTPPVTYSSSNGFSRTLDEVMTATESSSISLSSLHAMRNVMDLLNDMLQAVEPNIDHQADVNDEVIVDLVHQCRSNQKKLSQMLATIGEEELLGEGLDLNDSLQAVIEKHHAIASGSFVPTTKITLGPKEPDFSSTKLADSSMSRTSHDLCKSVPSGIQNQVEEEDDEDDEFAHLARRHSRTTPAGSFPCTSMVPISNPSMQDENRNERDMIDLLSLTVSSTSNQIPPTPKFNSYVVPWARPDPDHNQQRLPFQGEMPLTYDPPRWPATPGYPNIQNTGSLPPVGLGSAPGPNSKAGYLSAQQADRPLQKHDFALPERSSGLASNGNSLSVGPVQKPYVLPHKLFEDLNIMGAAKTVKDSRESVSSTQGGGASSGPSNFK